LHTQNFISRWDEKAACWAVIDSIPLDWLDYEFYKVKSADLDTPELITYREVEAQLQANPHTLRTFDNYVEHGLYPDQRTIFISSGRFAHLGERPVLKTAEGVFFTSEAFQAGEPAIQGEGAELSLARLFEPTWCNAKYAVPAFKAFLNGSD
jgi:hypothetical protein